MFLNNLTLLHMRQEYYLADCSDLLFSSSFKYWTSGLGWFYDSI